MRRRQPAETITLPRDLRVFNSTDWPGRDTAEQMLGWLKARREWAAAHKLDELPGDSSIVVPDGKFRPEDI
jgi:hypothetical protein